MKARSLILVVEDNEANQMLVRAVLELDGFDVRIAGSGPEALDVLGDCVPDLILMDVQLPGQDGLTLTRLIKADSATASLRWMLGASPTSPNRSTLARSVSR